MTFSLIRSSSKLSSDLNGCHKGMMWEKEHSIKSQKTWVSSSIFWLCDLGVLFKVSVLQFPNR